MSAPLPADALPARRKPPASTPDAGIYLADKVATLAKVVGADGLARDAEKAAVSLGAFGEALTDESMKLASEGLDQVHASWEGLNDALIRSGELLDAFDGFLARIRAGRGGDEGRPVLFGDRRIEDEVLGAVEDVATRVTDIFGGAAARIAELFRGLATNMELDLGQGTRAVLTGVGSVFSGTAALGTQVERAFGRSSAAANVFAKVQLGLNATLSMTRGLMELAESKSKFATGDVAAGALHAAAAASFFTAASFSGAQAAGAFGDAGGGSGGSVGGSLRADAGSTVAPRQTQITIHVEGNLVGNEEYLLNTIVPGLRRLVEEQDVVVIASHARSAQHARGL